MPKDPSMASTAALRKWTLIHDSFARHFGGEPALHSQAPGRVNLIGEHTDYNDGLVLPAAIDRHVRLAVRPNTSRTVRLYSIAFDAFAEFSLDRGERLSGPPWALYVQGVVRELVHREIPLIGMDAVIGGDLAIGAGLSSSAAFELATALALEGVSGRPMPARENVVLCRAAEVEYVGVPCGIMDQFASALCRRGHLLFLDCRPLETHHIPLGKDLVIAVCDTGVRRTLAASPYHVRRRECLEAIDALRGSGRPIQSLRDLTLADLPLLEQLPAPLGRRARHVVTENARVVATARLITGGSLEGLRDLLSASHHSLRDDYEVSCLELDAMVDAAVMAPGCVGARMTGAGFGGAVVALVRRAEQDAFLQAVAADYLRRTGRPGAFFFTDAVDGAAILGPPRSKLLD